ncbi:phosphoribosyltransferase-like protein [Shewanella algae]|uniref:phosphoribosyltransferase-like protein n=1 Tax=Shewanella algae TaxID=38313 RepID=UPI001C58B02A|nr:hypothetical protein [Shewanella algae]
MAIEEIPRVKQWLSQFDAALPDHYLANYLLKKMRFVPFQEVEEWLQKSVEGLIEDIEKQEGKKVPIAIFPVAKPFINKFNAEKEKKSANDSAGRISHALRNLERRLPKHVELTPRDDSMRARKVKHIIYVDDFIGTGDRFIKSWRNMVSARIKSWCSRGWCKIWVLSFAAHKTGINNIASQIRQVGKSSLKANLVIEKSFLAENKELVRLADSYGYKLKKCEVRLGYGKLLSPIIFQHGCPNNVPAIFWSSGKNGWTPLFPERSVPSELYALFSFDMSAETTAEELWMVGHYDLAVSIVNQIAQYRGDHQLVMILGFLEKRKDIERIRNVLVLTTKEMCEKLDDLRQHGLIDSDNKVTNFGLEILKRGKREAELKQDNNDAYNYFYPESFLGFQREV